MEGKNTVWARLSDGLNEAPETSATTMVLHTTPTAATIDALLAPDGTPEPDGLTASAKPRLTGTVEAGATIELHDANGILPIVAPDGSWTGQPGELADWTHVYRALVMDAAENQAWTADPAFVVDIAVAPATLTEVFVDDRNQPESLALASGCTASDTSPLLRGTAERMARIQIHVDGVLAG